MGVGAGMTANPKVNSLSVAATGITPGCDFNVDAIEPAVDFTTSTAVSAFSTFVGVYTSIDVTGVDQIVVSGNLCCD